MKTCNRLMIVGLAMGTGAGALAVEQQQVSYRIVAKTGDPAPGVAGAAFIALGVPRLNDDGEVAFQGALSSDTGSSGIWSEGFGGVGDARLVAREGQRIPDGSAMSFGDLSDGAWAPLINNNGVVAFSAPVLGGSVGSAVGVLRDKDGVLQRVVLPGMVAPGTGGFFDAISHLPSLSESDAVSFRASFFGFGVNDGNDVAIWTDSDGPLEMHLREGDAAPGTPGGVFTDFGFVVAPINGAGEVSAVNYVVAGGEPRWSLYMGPAAAPTLEAQQAWNTPLGPLTTFGGTLYGFGDHAINDAGDVLYPQRFEGPGGGGQGLWVRRGGTTEVVAAVGTASPFGSTYTHVATTGYAINGGGEVSFLASASGEGVTPGTDTALLRRDASGGVRVIFREGFPAPDAGPGTALGALMQGTINNRGQTGLHAELSGLGVDASNDGAFYLGRATSGARMLMREGQTIELSPGDARTVSEFSIILARGPESGRPSGLNRNGQAAFRVEFTDGSQAIVVSETMVDCPGDLNGDHIVDMSDLTILLTSFGDGVTAGTAGDVDLDGDVDFADLNALLVLFGTNCLPPV